MKIEVGDKVAAPKTTIAYSQYGECEILALTSDKAWLMDQNGETFDWGRKRIENNWIKPVKFFELGKKYRSKGVLRGDVYEIVELHLIDRPLDESHRHAAVVHVHDYYSGKIYLSVLSGDDFKYMEEVPK